MLKYVEAFMEVKKEGSNNLTVALKGQIVFKLTMHKILPNPTIVLLYTLQVDCL